MTYHFVKGLRFISITQKIISLLVIGVHLGSSILLYVESLGKRLPLMRTPLSDEEDPSSDMELYFMVLWWYFILWNALEDNEMDYFTGFFGGNCNSKEEENVQRFMYSDCMWPSSCRWQPTTCLRWKNGKHVVYFLHIINLLSFQAWSRHVNYFKKAKCIHEERSSLSLYCWKQWFNWGWAKAKL